MTTIRDQKLVSNRLEEPKCVHFVTILGLSDFGLNFFSTMISFELTTNVKTSTNVETWNILLTNVKTIDKCEKRPSTNVNKIRRQTIKSTYVKPLHRQM